ETRPDRIAPEAAEAGDDGPTHGSLMRGGTGALGGGMTFGIGISGPGAGLAAIRALQAVEAVSRGMIGGFVSLAVAGENGEVLRAATQRGGSASLFGHGATGGKPPREFAAA